MNNSTNASTVANQVSAGWYTFQVATACYFIAGTYIFAALLRYEAINGKFRGPYLTSRFLMKIIAMLSCLCLVSSTFTTQVSLLVSRGVFSHQLRVCELSLRIEAFVVSLGVTCTHAFLWFRQYVFYRQGRFRHMSNRLVAVLSSATIALVVLGFVAACVAFSLERSSMGLVGYGCTYKYMSEFLKSFLMCLDVFYILTILVLFGLFVYPLVAGPAVTNDISTVSRDVNEVKYAIRVSIWSAATCTLSSLLRIVLGRSSVVRREALPSFYMSSACELTLLVSIVSMLLTYGEYKKILFGCCRS